MNSCPPFVRKTYQLVCDLNTNSIVSWSNNGKSFTIWQTQMFQKQILPQYFKHNNLCSFIRQLNTYGFHKVNAPESVSGMEFAHPFFQYSALHLLPKICRKTPKKQTQTIVSPNQVITSPCGSPQAVSDDKVAQTLISLLQRQKESEKLLLSVCKELEETRTIIDTLGKPKTGEIMCGKRKRQVDETKEPAFKAVKCEFDDDLTAWPLSFDDLFRDTGATCATNVREVESVPQPTFDLSQVLLDF